MIAKWLREFIFEQKCMPWGAYKKYCKFRNKVFNINTQKHWDNVWGKEKDNPPHHRFYPEAYGEIISIVPHKSKIIDIGCGIGILMTRLKEENNCDVFGVDISKAAIETVKIKNMDGITARIPPIPLPSESFDVAIATELLEHVNSPFSVLIEMVRVTKPCGMLILTVPENALAPHREREHVRVFTEESLKKLFSKLTMIKRIGIMRVREQNEKSNRIIVKAKKTGNK